MSRSLMDAARVVEASGLFDAEWYLARYPDAAMSGLPPLWHYLQVGAPLWRSPGPGFNARAYVAAHRRSKAARRHPLLHYLKTSGVMEAKSNTDISPNALPALAILAHSPQFNAAWYACEYRDVADLGLDPAWHYHHNGAAEGRDPGPNFSTAWYVSQCPEALGRGMNPVAHYELAGRRQGLSPLPPHSPLPPWWAALEGGRYCVPAPDLFLAALERAHAAPPVTVVIPIYNAVDALRPCLDAVARNTPRDCRVLLLDDASPDPAVPALLADYASRPGWELHRHPENLGFTRTVNHGLILAGRADVLLLNADTLPPPRWVQQLRLAAHAGADIGTATAISNNAGEFSVPLAGRDNPLPAWITHDAYARAQAQAARRRWPETPTGNGFCLYLRRDCLDAVGGFDARRFPRGYGEENDFCMRALALGWRHVIDDATHVAHVGSASFGQERQARLAEGLAAVRQAHPDYDARVAACMGGPELAAVREHAGRIRKALTLDRSPVRPRVLMVLSTRTGGTPRTARDIMDALAHRYECFVLQSSPAMVSLMHYEGGRYETLHWHPLAEPVRAMPHRSREYDAVVAGWLTAYAFELVHVHHIAWHSLGLLDVCTMAGLPVVYSVHDFYAICPSVNLLDDTGRHCQGQCREDVRHCPPLLWQPQDFQGAEDPSGRAWRAQFAAALARCDAFVVMSPRSRALLLEHLPGLQGRPMHCIPHGRDFGPFESLAAPYAPGEPLRLLLPGTLTRIKGAEVLAGLLAHFTPQELEVHVLGEVLGDFPALDQAREAGRLIVHGKYRRGAFADKVRAIRPHLGGVLSVWPETFCHTLTELWACGVPALGFDLGAVGERLLETGAGWLAPTPDAVGAGAVVEQIRQNPKLLETACRAVQAWQQGEGRQRDCQAMGRDYARLYAELMGVSHIQLIPQISQAQQADEPAPDDTASDSATPDDDAADLRPWLAPLSPVPASREPVFLDRTLYRASPEEIRLIIPPGLLPAEQAAPAWVSALVEGLAQAVPGARLFVIGGPAGRGIQTIPVPEHASPHELFVAWLRRVYTTMQLALTPAMEGTPSAVVERAALECAAAGLACLKMEGRDPAPAAWATAIQDALADPVSLAMRTDATRQRLARLVRDCSDTTKKGWIRLELLSNPAPRRGAP